MRTEVVKLLDEVKEAIKEYKSLLENESSNDAMEQAKYMGKMVILEQLRERLEQILG